MAAERAQTGWGDGVVVRRVFSIEHKEIGRSYLIAAAVFLVGLAIDRLLLYLDLAHVPGGLLGDLGEQQVLALAGTMAVFHVGLPLALGLASYLVPLQVGARRSAWPTANGLAFWLYLSGATAMLFGFVNGEPSADSPTAPLTAEGQRLWLCGLLLVCVAAAMVGGVLLATLARGRAPGMTRARLPLLAWSAGLFAIALLGAAVVTGAMAAVALIDLDAAAGFFTYDFAEASYLQTLAWYAGQPFTYALLVPAIATVGEALAVRAGHDPLARRLERLAVLGAAALSLALSLYHLLADALGQSFADGIPHAFFVALAPLALAAAAALLRLRRVREQRPEALLGLGFVAVIVTGGVLAFALAFPGDYEAGTDGVHLFGHLDGTLAGATLLAFALGALYWFPKITGRLLDERAALPASGLLVLGTLCTVIGLHVAGEGDLAAWSTGAKVGTSLALAGCLLVLLGGTALAAGALASARAGTRVGPDPWRADTLEWLAESPPPPGNFGRLPPVESDRPLHDLRERLETRARQPRVAATAPTSDAAAVS